VWAWFDRARPRGDRRHGSAAADNAVLIGARPTARMIIVRAGRRSARQLADKARARSRTGYPSRTVPLFVVAYPRLSDVDRTWIAALRGEHDAAMHRVIGPHVTLVFASERLDADALATHTAAVARGCSRFVCTFRHARAVQDALSPAAHVFLIPSAGRSELLQLHDRLYSGQLAPELRSDLAYEPHITVACKSSLADAAQLAARIPPFDIRASVDELHVLTLVGGDIVASQQIPLGAESPASGTRGPSHS
jgi:2'-5' RNA ligase